ncbi:hypothetical protein Lpp122_1928 [Lacticaseibacillus paracasei subsp. paracasei Lpp122]|uniref:Uncharacterized protein n=1 Tax=Lacticaseibacillus paracasei subsp. paracasei Lpp122 TaxID=1256218 RepID=A0A8E0I4D1_LACPA|nr:hypothetical protein Lpp122_1928 [Lacticaseibacillus paracasei subsp. paracasei Lpp122]OUC68523.1 hypothetical protein BLL69_1092c [Lacticaseibacillus paracasei]
MFSLLSQLEQDFFYGQQVAQNAAKQKRRVCTRRFCLIYLLMLNQLV